MDDLPPIGLGTYENTDPEECAHAVEYALDHGYRHVDTAEGYDNEECVGEGIRRSDVDREDVFLATKVSPDNLGHTDVVEHARESADRLGVDYLDLLYVHWPLGEYDPEGTLSALDRVREEGLVRNVGVSNFTPDLLEEAIETLDSPLFAHQVECHPLLQQDELRRLAREHDHQLVAYSPLAKGEVTAVSELVEVAEKHDATPAQVALAWLTDKDNVVAIPKSASEGHIEENFAARDLQLEPADVERIDAIDREHREVDFSEAPWNQ